MGYDEERLTLAVRAQVAMIRAERARGRSALFERRARAVSDAMARFRRAYRREPGPTPSDVGTVARWAAELGGAELTPGFLGAAAAALDEAVRLEEAAIAALDALRAAMGEDGTVLEWIGCDAAAFERAVEAALAEGSPC